MPLTKISLRPGINKESTTYAGEGGWFESQLVRFRSGYPEKIGGWVRNGTSTFYGIARLLWNWVTLTGYNLLGVGTNQKMYVESGAAYNDITPQVRDATPPFAVVTTKTILTYGMSATTGSKKVTVTCAAHGSSVGSFVTIPGSTTVGSLTIGGEYELVEVLDGNTFTIAAASASTSNGSGPSAGSLTLTFQIAAGNSVYTTGFGWGAGVWNNVVFGAASTTLKGAINSVTGTITVNSTTGFPASGSIVIESEIISYTGTTTLPDTFTGCTRGTLLSSATAHISGVAVQQYSSKTSGSAAHGWGTAASSSGVGQQLRLWTMDNYGQDLVFAQRNGALYYWTADTSSFARAQPLTKLTYDLYTSSATLYPYDWRFVPTQTLVLKASDIQRFVICFGANPYIPVSATYPNPQDSAFDPMLVRWSDQENIYQWAQLSTNQAGEQRMSHGSTIVGALTTRQEILVWTDSALYSMQYLGPPYVWGFTVLLDSISIISPNCTASAATVVYWMGNDKFYSYSGRVETLPCTLRTYVYNDLNRSQAYQIVCGTNEGYNEVWWHYPSANSLVNNRYVIYNYLDRVWYHGDLNRSAWLDSSLRQYPMGSFSIQQAYLSADISASATTIAVLDASSFPSSGTILIGTTQVEQITYTGITPSSFTGCIRGANGSTAATHSLYDTVTFLAPNQIMYHENGCDDGSLNPPVAIEAYVESSDYDIGDGHNFGLIWRMLPDITFDGSTATNPQVTLSVYPRRNSGSNYDAAADPTVTRTATYPVEQYTGQIYTRLRGRQMKMRVDSNSTGVAWQLGTPRVDIRQSGRK